MKLSMNSCFFVCVFVAVVFVSVKNQMKVYEAAQSHTRTHFASFVSSLVHQLKRILHNKNLPYYLFIKFYAKLKSSQHKYPYKCWATVCSLCLSFVSQFAAIIFVLFMFAFQK